ncbi:MAG: hypothetical protein JSW10_10755 [Pseudomonadota bacterium]|nr:MAG: hypothetical protein JSW10_10755 [Pseudomonadota bacterium]
MKMTPVTLAKTALISIAAAGVVACGGGGGEDATGGGTTTVAAGPITGFGSVYVNGERFDTSNATVYIDDDEAFESDLRIGMVVRIEGRMNADGNGGTADSVHYDAEIKGPISNMASPSATTRTFDIYGQMVSVDSADTRCEYCSFDSLMDGDVVEVSGYYDQSGTLYALHVEKEGDYLPGQSEVEVKGNVKNYDGGNSFDLEMHGGASVKIMTDNMTDMHDLPGGLANDMYVEVEGIGQADGSVLAREIEIEDYHDMDDMDGHAEVYGMVTNYNGIGSFMVNGMMVDASNAKFEPATLRDTLGNNMFVEVEGNMVNGTMVATEVEDESYEDEGEYDGSSSDSTPS